MNYLREVPLVIFLVGAVFASIYFVLVRNLSPSLQIGCLRRLALACGALTLTMFVALNFVALRGYFIWGDEANILSIAAAGLHGQPVYHAVTSPDLCYSLMYGPLTFLVYQALLVIGGGRFWILKAAVGLVNLLTCAVLFSILRKFVRRETALALIAFPLCALLLQAPSSFGIRSDAWIVLAMALATRSALIESEFLASVLTGVAAGIAIDFKVTVAPTFLLLLLMLYRRWGIKSVFISAGSSIATALVPFALPSVSLINYLSWLLATGHEGLDRNLVIYSFHYAVFLAAPLILLQLLGINPWQKKLHTGSVAEKCLLTVCLLLAAVISAKPGAGPWHFWSLLPILTAYLALAIGRSPQSSPVRLEYGVLLIALGSTLIAVADLRRDFIALCAPSATITEMLKDGRQDLDLYEALYRGRTLQMGYGESPDEVAETLRYILPLNGQRYTLDGSAFSVESSDGLPFPHGIIEKMERCSNSVWLFLMGNAHSSVASGSYFPRTSATHFYSITRWNDKGRSSMHGVAELNNSSGRGRVGRSPSFAKKSEGWGTRLPPEKLDTPEKQATQL